MEPPHEENWTRLFCEECPKERLLDEWERQIVELGIAPHIREFETVTGIQRLGDKDGFEVSTDQGDTLRPPRTRYCTSTMTVARGQSPSSSMVNSMDRT